MFEDKKIANCSMFRFFMFVIFGAEQEPVKYLSLHRATSSVATRATTKTYDLAKLNIDEPTD